VADVAIIGPKKQKARGSSPGSWSRFRESPFLADIHHGSKTDSAGTTKVLGQQQHAHGRPQADITIGTYMY
jgi:hypothetical protein